MGSVVCLKRASPLSSERNSVDEDNQQVKSLYFEVQWCEDFGRYLVAKEDIDEKTLLLCESSIIFGPSDDKDFKSDTVTVFCLACCKQLCPCDDKTGTTPPAKLYTCSRCKWPVCDKLCEKARIHSDNECSIFSSQNTGYPPPHQWLMYKSVILLRVLLLLKREPELWDEFLQKLEHHTEARHGKENCLRADEIVLENLEYFTHGLKIGSKKNVRKRRLPFLDDKGILERLIGALNVNAFCASNDSDMCKRLARCMFKTASLFAHSCAPNCCWTVRMCETDPKKSGSRKSKRKGKNGTSNGSDDQSRISPQIQVYSSVPIKKGEMITIPYSSRNIFYGTLKRQLCMESVGHFICKCRRCMSPSELGTYMSAIRCFKCDKGFLLTTNVTDDEARWKCIEKECGSVCSVGKVVYFVTKVQDQIDLVKSRDLEWFEEQRQLQRIFDKYYGKELHENHYLLHEISSSIVELLTERLTDFPGDHETLLGRYVWHVKYLKELADVILPGYNNYQDQLAFYLEYAESLRQPPALQNGF